MFAYQARWPSLASWLWAASVASVHIVLCAALFFVPCINVIALLCRGSRTTVPSGRVRVASLRPNPVFCATTAGDAVSQQHKQAKSSSAQGKKRQQRGGNSSRHASRSRSSSPNNGAPDKQPKSHTTRGSRTSTIMELPSNTSSPCSSSSCSLLPAEPRLDHRSTCSVEAGRGLTTAAEAAHGSSAAGRTGKIQHAQE